MRVTLQLLHNCWAVGYGAGGSEDPPLRDGLPARSWHYALRGRSLIDAPPALFAHQAAPAEAAR